MFGDGDYVQGHALPTSGDIGDLNPFYCFVVLTRANYSS